MRASVQGLGMHGVTVDMGPCPTTLLVTRLDWGQSNTQMWLLILESWRETGVCHFMRVLMRGLGHHQAPVGGGRARKGQPPISWGLTRKLISNTPV